MKNRISLALLVVLLGSFLAGDPASAAGICGGITTTTADTSSHAFKFPTNIGHAVHLSVDWTCVWSSGANADGGRVDALCTDSGGTVTCATNSSNPSEHIGTEGCNTPTVTAGTGDSFNVTISASTTSSVSWNVNLVDINAN